MSRMLIAATVFVLISPAALFAHRLDEYLQAARVSLERDGISLELDLTPGANIASAIVRLLDLDSSGTISPREAEAYGRDVLSKLVVQLDGAPVAVTVSRVEIPSIASMRDGLGVIQVQAVGKVGPLMAGRHLLHLRNNHQPVSSVYLVNAVSPDDRDIGVVAQRRDVHQQAVEIEYNVRSHLLTQLISLVLAAGLSVLLWLARTRLPRPRVPRTHQRERPLVPSNF